MWKNVVASGIHNNLLDVIYRVKDPTAPNPYPPEFIQNMLSTLPRNEERMPKASMDLAGKWPLALKLYDLGLKDRVFIDYNIAGGVLSRDGRSPDGLFMRHEDSLADWISTGASGVDIIEIKGAVSPPELNDWNYPITIFPRGMREKMVEQSHIFFLLRVSNPRDWTDLRELESLIDVGYAKLSDFMALLRTYKDSDSSEPYSEKSTQGWTFTLNPKYMNPEYRGRNDSMSKQLSKAVEWVQLKDLTPEWFYSKGLLSPPDGVGDGAAAAVAPPESDSSQGSGSSVVSVPDPDRRADGAPPRRRGRSAFADFYPPATRERYGDILCSECMTGLRL